MKAVLPNKKLISGQSTASNFTTPVFTVIESDVIGLQINYTGAPSGTFKVQGSVDYSQDSQGNTLNAGNWFDMFVSINGGNPTNVIAVPANTSPIFIDLDGSSVPTLRVVYTGSGAGSFDLWITYKRLGD